MTNVAEMTHQELIDGAKGRWGLGKAAVCEAELLRRLGAAVSASPQPRCPICQSTELDLYATPLGVVRVHCSGEQTHPAHVLITVADCWKFFAEPASTGEPPPVFEQLRAHGDEPPESVKLVGNRLPTESEIEYGKQLEPMAKECLERNEAKMERAARPSEPAALDGILGGVGSAAPQTSAEPCDYLCGWCHSALVEIRCPNSNCKVFGLTVARANMLADKLENGEMSQMPDDEEESAAPQPVSGDAPGIKVKIYDPIAYLQELYADMGKRGECEICLKLQFCIEVLKEK